MPNHHHAAELNLDQIFEWAANVGDATMTTSEAQAMFTERVALATVANTQALLAINETLMAILARMPRTETP